MWRRNAERLLLLSLALLTPGLALAQLERARVGVHWDKVLATSKAVPTLQVVVNPMLRRGSRIHDPVFKALHDLGADDVRYVPWLPYPKLGVAELDAPTDGKTSWNFSLIDPMTIDFLEATRGHPVILNFSTIPQWMFKTEKPVPYPADPDRVTWSYEQGAEFRDPSLKEVADYYQRLVSWYTKGGFSDEYGQWHESGHHYEIEYWEVLNEVDSEHSMTPETYTRVYDAVVSAIRGAAPQMKFVGLALSDPSKAPEFFEYFLDHRNHQPGIPLDMISYHFYASPTADQNPYAQQFTFFEQADHFLDVVRYIESIRKRLSPETQTTIDEIGAISADDGAQSVPGHVAKPIPDSYWNLCAAMYAYIYAELARQGIEVAGESQLVGYPTQFPSVSMVDWNTGQPNARYWVLKLLRDNLSAGDQLVDTTVSNSYLYAQGFVTPEGKRKLLLINKRDRTLAISLPELPKARVEIVDQATGFKAPASSQLAGEQLTLPGLGVALLTAQ